MNLRHRAPSPLVPGRLRGLVALFAAAIALAAPAAFAQTEADSPAESLTASPTEEGAQREIEGSPGEVTPTKSAAPTLEPGEVIYSVGRIRLVYTQPHPDAPSLDDLLPVSVPLARSGDHWVSPGPGQPGEPVGIGVGDAPLRLQASALGDLLSVIVAQLNARDLLGVFVRPDPTQIDTRNGEDLRPPGETELTLQVAIGRVTRVRTIARGDRVDPSWQIDNIVHRAIREGSPIRPAIAGEPGKTDLLRRDLLEDYLFRVNRHPGRRVAAALAADTDGQGISLDYQVNEARPWFVYGQVSNTGSERTNPWQSRFGVVHRQLTDRDDILSLEYMNSGFDDVNGFTFSYDAPFFGARRPEWMKTQPEDPPWLKSLRREKVPWWGNDRLRWSFGGSYNYFVAGQVVVNPGIQNNPLAKPFVTDKVSSEDLNFDGRLTYNAWQHRNLFVDVYAGLRYRLLDSYNQTLETTGREHFVVPEIGVSLERNNEYSTIGLDVSGEVVANHLQFEELEQMGRIDPETRWAVLRFSGGVSHYLEPLLNPEAWKDPSTPSSSTLAHEVSIGVRGQYAFDYRLIPQATQVIGGQYSVRGYDQSAAVGDSVVIATFEYRFHLPQILPIQREPLSIPLLGDFRAAPQQVYGRPDWDLALRAFFDFGYAWRNDRFKLASRLEYDQALYGAGVGAELRIRSNFRARLDYGVALKDAKPPQQDNKAGDQKIHLLFSILY